MCACVRACVRAFMCACVCACVCVSARARACVRARVRECACMRVRPRRAPHRLMWSAAYPATCSRGELGSAASIRSQRELGLCLLCVACPEHLPPPVRRAAADGLLRHPERQCLCPLSGQIDGRMGGSARLVRVTLLARPAAAAPVDGTCLGSCVRIRATRGRRRAYTPFGRGGRASCMTPVKRSARQRQSSLQCVNLQTKYYYSPAS
jgi:hypothetical protein